jgi:hypothetical protein
MPITAVPERLRQEDGEFMVGLAYIMRPRFKKTITSFYDFFKDSIIKS